MLVPFQVLLRRGHDQQGAGQAFRLQVCVRPEDSDWLQRGRAQQPGDGVRAEEAGPHADARPGTAHHHGNAGHLTGQGQLKSEPRRRPEITHPSEVDPR